MPQEAPFSSPEYLTVYEIYISVTKIRLTVLICRVCCSWCHSNLQVNKSPMTCLPSHTFIYSKYDMVKRFPHTFITLNNSLSNLMIPSQRLVTMSVSLCTQTVSHCLILQVLNIKSLLPKCLIQSLLTSVISNLEHGLAILTESFSPLRSVLHNLSCWNHYTMYT